MVQIYTVQADTKRTYSAAFGRWATRFLGFGGAFFVAVFFKIGAR
jgi:hypothetical protein